MLHRVYSLAWLTIVGATLLGCGSTDEPPPETAAAAPAAPAKTEPPTPPAAQPVEEPTLVEESTANGAIVQFSPPFPDRLELFEPLQRAQGTIRRDDEGETVELKGFINVDQPKVVLAIDGVDSAIPEGGEQYGVQVISIEPPVVVLQRGRNRWKATLD